MSFDPRDYDGVTFESEEAERREEEERFTEKRKEMATAHAQAEYGEVAA